MVMIIFASLWPYRMCLAVHAARHRRPTSAVVCHVLSSCFVLSRHRFGITAKEDSEERAVLVEDLETLAITYFGQAKGDGVPDWYGNWDDSHRKLPNLLRISVKPSTGPAWPELIASPMMGAEPLQKSVPTSEHPDPETTAAMKQ